MRSLTVIVPSRGRPHTVAQLARAFRDTCTAGTWLLFAVDEDDPEHAAYRDAVDEALCAYGGVQLTAQPSGTMVSALNQAAQLLLDTRPHVRPDAIGFMGDDHRPRTKGWDRAYLDALTSLPGIVYGNDRIQGVSLPTQCAMSAGVIRALGHMAPPPLAHLYVDNYWLTLGHAADCITYLPDVVVEHVHPVAGAVAWDEGHRRVNAPAMYARDREAYEQYLAEHLAGDLAKVARAKEEAAR
ncbi:hypothetical protein ABZ890_11950 [Streptomyces sp. NPDC046984]|uniref:hypothetical protein n=1 Tax=Streptomyces sp. NPDC046984 TaxID=3155138 RepID=UPI0033FB9BA7